MSNVVKPQYFVPTKLNDFTVLENPVLPNEEYNAKTPGVYCLCVGACPCSLENLGGQVAGGPTERLHQGHRVHKLGQSKVCDLDQRLLVISLK